MQYGDGTQWRNKAKAILEPMSVKCFDPYHKPFINAAPEDDEARKVLLGKVADGNFDEVSDYMKEVRKFDLNMVDRCDFMLAYVDIRIPTCGTWEEIFWANRLKKPLFLIIEGGKKNTPLWVFGTIPHKYIYDDLDSALAMLQDIDSRRVNIDSDRWRLLLPEFR